MVNFLGQLISRMTAGGAASAISVAAAVVIVGVSVWLVTMVVRSARRGAVGKSPPPPRQAPAMTGEDWRARALEQEGAGAWREALRCRYRALVADLASAGLVNEAPGRTTGEYRQQVAMATPEGAAPFGLVTDLFEASWYGGRPTGPKETAQARSLSDTVLSDTVLPHTLLTGARSRR